MKTNTKKFKHPIIARPKSSRIDVDGNVIEFGKAQPLIQHLRNVANRSETGAKSFNLGKLGWVMGACHDAKATLPWQNYINGSIDERKQLRGKVDHVTLACAFVNYLLNDWLKNYKNALKNTLNPSDYNMQMDSTIRSVRIARDLICVPIASHHSGLTDMEPMSPNDEIYCAKFTYYHRIDKNRKINNIECNIVINDLIDTYQIYYPKFLIEIKTAIDFAVNEVINHDVLSNDNECTYAYVLTIIKHLFSILVDADGNDAANHESKNYKDSPELYDRYSRYVYEQKMFSSIDSIYKIANLHHSQRKYAYSPINCLRNDFYNQVTQAMRSQSDCAFLCYGPTGIGKTHTVLMGAIEHAKKYKKDRIIYLAPFTAIIEQNAKEARELFESKNKKTMNVLEHHSNVFIDNKYNRFLYCLMNAAHRSPIIFETFVRFFDSMTSNKISDNRRWKSDMYNSIIIIDECQDIPVEYRDFYIDILNELIKRFRCTIVFCSATIPDIFDNGFNGIKPFVKIIDEPTRFESELKKHRKIIEDRSLMSINCESQTTLTDLAFHIVNNTNKIGSSLCIAATKKSAKSIYRECKKISDKIKIFHLSTYMCAAHRIKTLKMINKCLANNEKIIVISTSLIEAGVDVDFPVVYKSARVSITSVVQAQGRCNRHGLYDSGYFYLYTLPESDESTKHYGNRRLWSDIVYSKFDTIDYNATKYYSMLEREYLSIDGGFDKKMIQFGITNQGEPKLVGPYEMMNKHVVGMYFGGAHKYPWLKPQTNMQSNYEQSVAKTCLGIPFESISVCKCISNAQVSIFIPIDQKGQDLRKKIIDGSITVRELRDIQRYTVSLYDTDYERFKRTHGENVIIEVECPLSESNIAKILMLNADCVGSSQSRYYRDDEGLVLDDYIEFV